MIPFALENPEMRGKSHPILAIPKKMRYNIVIMRILEILRGE